jgi:hypothetical protein
MLCTIKFFGPAGVEPTSNDVLGALHSESRDHTGRAVGSPREEQYTIEGHRWVSISTQAVWAIRATEIT